MCGLIIIIICPVKLNLATLRVGDTIGFWTLVSSQCVCVL